MADPLPPAQDPSAAHLESAANLAQHEPQQALVHAVIALVHEQRRAADEQGRIVDILNDHTIEREVAWRDR